MHRVEKNSEAISKIHQKEWGDPLAMSAIVTGGDGSVFAIPDPHPIPSLLIMKPFLLINGNSILLTTQAKNFPVSLCIPFSLPHSQPLGKSCVSIQKVFRLQPLLTIPMGAAQSVTIMSPLNYCKGLVSLLPILPREVQVNLVKPVPDHATPHLKAPQELPPHQCKSQGLVHKTHPHRPRVLPSPCSLQLHWQPCFSLKTPGLFRTFEHAVFLPEIHATCSLAFFRLCSDVMLLGPPFPLGLVLPFSFLVL